MRYDDPPDSATTSLTGFLQNDGDDLDEVVVV